MPRPSALYRIGIRLGSALLPVAALAGGKLGRAHRGRIGVLRRLETWGSAGREPHRPLVWFHAPSVGEGLQAESVLARLRARHPHWQIAYTYFSPSAGAFAARLRERVGAELADYLPYDTPGAVERTLDALRPDALVFTKLDLWPELATAAAGRGIPVLLVAATVRPGSGRLRGPIRRLLAPGYAAVSRAGAISPEDAERLASLGVAADRIEVTGDPRFDSVVERIAGLGPDDPLFRFGTGAPTLVAGSTWPGDEGVLLRAFTRVRSHRPDARLILVPHEPVPSHLDAIDRRAGRLGLPRPVRLGAADGPVPLLLVDRVGLLAKLYGAGAMAYVGGGFHRAGLHSVLEPAAWGIPVAFGPRWRESRDARLLVEAGGAEALEESVEARAAERLAVLWEAWLVDERRRAAQGRAARRVVLEGAGAADRNAALVERMVARA
ncbi:MAG TPA: glycosyltransferase N-terminal domain-containing protein [Gemmatimonadales bacterium]|nr:glycosyltransferase N-terminal domain-containing protein [Gemmatimonadales bacterium]